MSSFAVAPSSSDRPIPWYIWASVLAAACIVSGLYWDISWHETIGRDTFWTPAHLLIQFGAVLAGIYSSWLIFGTTFGKNAAAQSISVRVLGFRGPLGAFICAWGGAAMISSAPFDNWWHEAYGLDVKILSPPHVLLALGMIAIRFGTLVMILSEFNRAQEGYRAKLERLVFVGFIFLLGMTLGIAQEHTGREAMHSASFYLVVMIIVPVWIAAAARASGHRWAA